MPYVCLIMIGVSVLTLKTGVTFQNIIFQGNYFAIEWGYSADVNGAVVTICNKKFQV